MEIPDQVGEDKFKVNDDYDFDKCRIAQWLRAIDTLNREADFSEFATDSVFRVLQNAVKLCNFSAGYMLSNIMKDIDKSYWEYGAARKTKKEIAKKMLAMNKPIDEIADLTGLPQSTVLELKTKVSRWKRGCFTGISFC